MPVLLLYHATAYEVFDFINMELREPLTTCMKNYPKLQLEINRRGGLFQQDPALGSLNANFHNIIVRLSRHREFAEEHLYSPNKPSIELGLLNDTRLNAVAISAPDAGDNKTVDFIGINVGTLHTLANTFFRILAHPNTFLDVGNPSQETADGHDLPYLSTDAIISQQYPLLPKCVVRARFASELAQIALDFLFFHEITHLRNGHVDYIKQHSISSYLDETEVQNQVTVSNEIRQALEVDADCGAIRQTLNAALRFKRRLANPLSTAPQQDYIAMECVYGSLEKAIRSVLFSAYMLFRIFEVDIWCRETQPKYSHPFHPLRMFLITEVLYEIFSQVPEYGFDPSDFLKLSEKVILEAENACGLVKGEPPDMRGIYSVVSQESGFLYYINDFKKTWANIRPELDIYKRGGQLAP